MRPELKRRRNLEKAKDMLFQGKSLTEIGNQLELKPNSVGRLLSEETRRYGGAKVIRSSHNAATARLLRHLGATWKEIGDYFGISPGSAFNRAQYANNENIPIVVELNLRTVEPIKTTDSNVPTGEYELTYGPRNTVVLTGPKGMYQIEVDKLVGCVELGHRHKSKQIN